jgi:DNA-binding response OmpR family regulator
LENIAQSILLLEDDRNLGTVIQENLQMRGYEVTLCADGDAGKKAYGRRPYDLCLVDVMMPKKDGFTFAREVRQIDEATPIIFLTAKAMREDRIEGLTIGADDYITKPFSMEELILRIQAVLRRTSGAGASSQPAESYALGNYTFDVVGRNLSFDGKSQRLTTKEADLLALLCQYRNEVLPREIALKRIWGDDSYFNSRSMDVFLSKLRNYLKEDDRLEILTVHGKGVKLRTP